MGDFLKTGYFIFAAVLLFNVQVTFFTPSQVYGSYLQTQATDGLTTPGVLDYENIPVNDPTANPFITDDTTATNTQPNPIDTLTKQLQPDVLTLLNNVVFAFADTVEGSGIPNPIAWIMAVIIKIFMSTYIFFTGLNIKNAIFGGGTAQ